MLPVLRPTYNSMIRNDLHKLFTDNSLGRDYSSLGIPIEVFDQDTSWLVKAYLPGVKKEDVNLDVENGRLYISAVRHRPEQKIYLSEIEYGKMESVVKLTSTSYLEKDNISAKYIEGVLHITIGKPTNSIPYKVEIE